MTYCRFGSHQVTALDYLTHERADGETFTYCTSHEPLTDRRKARLEKWASESA